MIGIRGAAIAFALFSACYWAGCQYFFDITFVRAVGQQFDLPNLIVLTLPSVPVWIYALVCLVYFHWLKQRLIRSLALRSKDETNVH
jgi:hypothetical protein